MSLFRTVYNAIDWVLCDTVLKRQIALSVVNVLRDGEERRQAQDDILRQISASVVPKMLTQTCPRCHITVRAYSTEHLRREIVGHHCI